MFSKHVNFPVDVSILPDSIRSVVARCLEKQPADRYQTIAELEEDLLRIRKTDKAKFHLTSKQRYSLKNWLYDRLCCGGRLTMVFQQIGGDMHFS